MVSRQWCGDRSVGTLISVTGLGLGLISYSWFLSLLLAFFFLQYGVMDINTLCRFVLLNLARPYLVSVESLLQKYLLAVVVRIIKSVASNWYSSRACDRVCSTVRL